MPVSGPRCSEINIPTKPCHNCRRSRLRCDRSLPSCGKCHAKGESCLGYGQLLRWTGAAAVRGKLARQTPQQQQQQPSSKALQELSALFASNAGDEVETTGTNLPAIQFSLVDPLLRDLGPRNRFYIRHYERSVCRDLVSSDQHDHKNPFRSMVTLLSGFDYLREIILATSAVHIVALRRSNGHSHNKELVDALTAKGRAYGLLRHAINNLDAASKPMVMIAVVFCINFDLIDSGRGKWKAHVEAAGNLIASLRDLEHQLPPSVAQLADIVVADCITYHVLGSLFANPNDHPTSAFKSIDLPATLQRAAAFSYGCSPPLVLDILSTASNLFPDDVAGAAGLLEQLCTLDVRTWVCNINGLPPLDDLEVRISLANAHRVAACLYIVLVVPRVSDALQLPCILTAESLLVETLGYLASVPVEHSLAKGAIWPTFMAGAQADDPVIRQWCLERMRVVGHSTPWVCPWGYIDSAMDMLQRVWQMRDDKTNYRQGSLNWLQEMRAMKDHCLIV